MVNIKHGLKNKVKSCLICGDNFVAKGDCLTHSQKYCSFKCSGLSRAKWKECKQCSKKFYNFLNKYFCSKKCAIKGMIGRKLTDLHKTSLSKAKQGKTFDENNNNWKGIRAGYGARHDWLKERLGKPKSCDDCGAEGKYVGRLRKVWSIQWANISGEYKRELIDWKGLCAKCHCKFDNNYVWKKSPNQIKTGKQNGLK